MKLADLIGRLAVCEKLSRAGYEDTAAELREALAELERAPSAALLAAQALVSENADATNSIVSRRLVRARWRPLTKESKRYWLRRGRRLVERMQALGVDL